MPHCKTHGVRRGEKRKESSQGKGSFLLSENNAESFLTLSAALVPANKSGTLAHRVHISFRIDQCLQPGTKDAFLIQAEMSSFKQDISNKMAEAREAWEPVEEPHSK